MIPAKHFYMIRHAESQANKDNVSAGEFDVPLTDNGIKQANTARKIIEKLRVKPKTIIHSGKLRTKTTAHIINTNLELPIYEDNKLSELDVGDLGNQPPKSYIHLFESLKTPPHGERFNDFFERLKNSKTKHLNTYDAPILIVSHGGVFRGLAGIYGLIAPITPGVFKNALLYEFEPDPNNKIFPWTVWTHDYIGVKTKSTIFNDSKKFTQLI